MLRADISDPQIAVDLIDLAMIAACPTIPDAKIHVRMPTDLQRYVGQGSLEIRRIFVKANQVDSHGTALPRTNMDVCQQQSMSFE